MHIVVLAFLLPFISILVFVYAVPAFTLKKRISQLGGKLNYKGEGVLSFEGRDIFIRYIPASRNRSAELRVSAAGHFGAQALIRYETPSDKFYKQIGLNRELQIPDREMGDKLYFECDDQEFLNFFLLNSRTKSEVLSLLKDYADIEITKDRCQLKKYPAGDLAMISREDILGMARQLVELSTLIPSSGGDHPELAVFKLKKVLMYGIGSIVSAAGGFSFLWASCEYRIVDAGRLWELSLNYSATIVIAAVSLAFFLIRGFSTSSKVFLFFLLTFSAGGILCGRYGAAVYNGFFDRSPVESFDQVVYNKYFTISRGSSNYYAVVQPWRPGRKGWVFRVSQGTYAFINPGSTHFQILTRSGRLGFEWVVAERYNPGQ